MMLRTFYRILSSEISDSECKTKIIFDKGHEIFKAHFPNHPIVPGACLIEMAKEMYIRARGENEVIIRKIHNIKFNHSLTSEDVAVFNLNWKDIDKVSMLNVSILVGEKICVKMILDLQNLIKK